MDMKERITEIGENHNGNHNRTIRDLEEVIDNLKQDQKYQKQIRRSKILGGLGVMFLFVIVVGATINYNINGNVELQVKEGEVSVGNNMDLDNTYWRYDITSTSPPASDCNVSQHYGRSIVLVNATMPPINKLYICDNIGWQYIKLT